MLLPAGAPAVTKQQAFSSMRCSLLASSSACSTSGLRSASRHTRCWVDRQQAVILGALSGRGSSDSGSSSSNGNGAGSESQWWSSINRTGPQGPVPSMPPAPPDSLEGWNKLRMGERGYRTFETLKRDERQRVWDNMRRIAGERYQRGEMPEWFKPEWLDVEEAPMNSFWRQQGLELYQHDSTWMGDGGNFGGPGNNGSSGRGWWREDDPYWFMRDWGDHPMRWWTCAFAALLAAGGLAAFLLHGSVDSVYVGMGAGALLAVCGMAMSDMRNSWYGEAAVKMAWATCLIMAAREYWWGWSHKRTQRYFDHEPKLGATGWASLAMCALYMTTGMSGLAQYSLPTNPGEAFKMVDVAQKHKVWENWGVGDLTMRQ